MKDRPPRPHGPHVAGGGTPEGGKGVASGQRAMPAPAVGVAGCDGRTAPKPGKTASPDLRSLALIHGPQVLRRMVKQLLGQRALLRELFAKKPRHTDRAAESGGGHKTQDSPRIEQREGVATPSADRNRSPESEPESESGSASPGAMQADAASDEEGRQLVAALTEDPAWMQTVL